MKSYLTLANHGANHCKYHDINNEFKKKIHFIAKTKLDKFCCRKLVFICGATCN